MWTEGIGEEEGSREEEGRGEEDEGSREEKGRGEELRRRGEVEEEEGSREEAKQKQSLKLKSGLATRINHCKRSSVTTASVTPRELSILEIKTHIFPASTPL